MLPHRSDDRSAHVFRPGVRHDPRAGCPTPPSPTSRTPAAGLPLRALARARGCHASTVLRQVRRIEAWRDDPLVDEALERIARDHAAEFAEHGAVSRSCRHAEHGRLDDRPSPDPRIEREARRILRRLCEKGAFLAVAPDDGEGGGAARGGAGQAEPHRRRRPRRGACLRAAGVDRLREGGQDRLLHHHRGRPGGAEAAADRGAQRARAAATASPRRRRRSRSSTASSPSAR